MWVVPGAVVNPPVEIGLPSVVPRLVKLVPEFLDSLFLRVGESESFAQVVDVIERAQFRNPGGEHHDEQSDEQVPLAA